MPVRSIGPGGPGEGVLTTSSTESINRLAAIVASSQDAIIGKTLSGVITSWNAGAETMYGYSADEIIGHNIDQLIPPDRVGELRSVIERVRRGESVPHFDTQRVAKDGRILEMSVAISPIRDDAGHVTGASTVARDITAITRATTDQHALEAQLHRAQRMESLGQLAGGVAHDFNNLIAGIMSYAGLVSDALRDEMDRVGPLEGVALCAIRDDVEQITNAAQRAADLTRQLLVFSRREVLLAQPLDVSAVVLDMEGLLRRTIGPNVDYMRTVLPTGLPLVTIDRGEIEQVIMNLAVNARDAMPDGGVLGMETSVLDIADDDALGRDAPQGSYVRLTVCDTGAGMSKEVAEQAFEPFFTTKPPGQGTGLGLATVFRIVTQVGGTVSICSDLGVGTTVHVDFPAGVVIGGPS
jgi:PAS domain S-box-containing protein